MQNNCNYSDNWQPYIGDYDKFEYDVKLEDGTIVENCYPNARKFNSISDLHDSQSFEESRVVEIRFSQSPRYGMNGKVSNAPQYEWMESQKTDPILESKVYHIFNNHIPYYLPKSKASHGTVMSVRTEPKVGRNQICPCGSGLKSKRCLHSQNIT